MKRKLFLMMLSMVTSIAAWSAENELFYKAMDNGFVVTYQIITQQNLNKTCRLYSVPKSYEGSITIPSEVHSNDGYFQVVEIGEKAFDGCSGLTSVSLPTVRLKTIKNNAFRDCTGLTSISIPDNVTTLEYSAFSGCTNLLTVEIGSGISSLTSGIFEGCNSISSITISGNNSTYDSRNNCNAIIKTSTDELIRGCNNTVIPSDVKKIGSSAFMGCSGLTSINIPASVTNIAYDAFWDCGNLASITVDPENTTYNSNNNCNAIIITAYKKLYIGCNNTVIPSGVERISGYAFYGSQIPSLTIPSSVIWISDPFKKCSSLNTIIIDEGNTTYDSRDNCNAIIKTETNELVAGCKGTVVPNSVTGIADYAFSNCSGLMSITIPESITSIGTCAFENCPNLTDVTINCTGSIGEWSFAGCGNLNTVRIGGKVTSMGQYTFQSCQGLQSVTVDNTIPPGWGNDSFNNCDLTNMTLFVPSESIDIYQSASGWKSFGAIEEMNSSPIIVFADDIVKAICVANWDTNEDGELSEAEAAAVTSKDWPQKAFKGNTLITSFDELQYFTGLSEIPYGAFSECYNLTTIVIPDNVKSISPLAFEGCSNLSTIIIPDAVTTIHTDAFADSKWLNDQPSGMVYAGKVAYTFKGDMPANTEIVLDEGTLGIADYAFQDFSGLSSITIPNSVTEIGQSAFNGCSNLTSVIIPGKVTSIAQRAFFGCSGLTSITIPNSVTSIENAAFYGCSGLVSVAIPDGVTSIGYEAFLGCSSLGSLSLPGGVKTIGNRAFSMCSNLTSVYVYWQTPLSLSTNIFLDSQGGTLYVPYGCKAAYQTATVWKDFGEIYEIFSAPIQLNDGTVDAQFRIIDENAKTVETFGTFSLGPAIEKATEGSITIPAEVNGYQVVGIGSWSFYSCQKITQVNLPGTLTYIGESAFRMCYQLQEMDVPEGVITIGDRAFYNGIRKLTLPSTLQELGSDIAISFSGNSGNVLIVKAVTPIAIGERSIRQKENTTLYVPVGCKAAYEAADYWKDFYTITELPKAPTGTEEDPFTCAGANTFVASLTASTPTEMEYYVKGKVCAIEENFSYKNGYATFRISDDGTDEGSFYVFHTKYFGSEDYAGGRVPNIGDEVVFCGKLVNHEGTTPETVDNQCRLASLNNKTVGTDLVAGDLFIAKTAEDVEMAFVAGCPARPGSSTASTNIGCSVGYAVNGMQTGLPAAIDADYNGNVTIPETVEGLEVRTIAPSAFANTKLYLVNVPATVWDIETDAFSGCTELAGVNLPENIILNRGTFKDCTSLTDIKLPKGVILYGGSNDDPIFSGCTSLTAIRVFDETPYALENKLVDDPSKVTLYVPAGSKAAYETADYWKDFGEIYEIFSAPIKLNDGTVDAQFRIIDENAKTVETFGTYRLGPAIEKATEGSITIPAEVNGYQVVGIGSWSFYSCKKITQVNLPGTLTYIGESAFRICYQLQEVNIPEGVTLIGLYAFKSCIFSSLTLPSSLQTIEEVAFEGCNELTSVTMSGSTPPTIGEYTFNINNPSNVTIYVPLGSLVAYQTADYWNMFNKILELEAEPVSPSFAESTIIPWGTDKAWEMKYMYFDEIGNVPATDGSGHAWTDAEFDDSSWATLTGPIARYENDFSVVNTIWEKENSCYYLRRTFNLDEVNEQGYYFCSRHDDNVKVWINGTQVVDAGFNGRYQYHHIPASAFVIGTNTMAIYLDDTGGGANLDYCMTNFYFLKNVETGKYLNVGDEWRAVLADEGLPVKLYKQADGSYTIYFPYGSQNQQLLYRVGEEGVYVDYSMDWAQFGVCPSWTFTDAGEGHIYIQALTTDPTYGQEAMPGTYLGNNPSSNNVAGNITAENNITWTIEPLPARTETQTARLQELVTAAKGLGLDTSGEETVLNNNEATYINMLDNILELQNRVNNEQNNINAKTQDLNKLIACAAAIGVSTSDAQVVADNPQNMESVNNAISTLRATYIAKLGEGVDVSLLPLDVTGAIINPSFAVNEADGWSWKDGEDGPGIGSSTADYRERTFDFHQTVSGLPNGSYLLKVKGFHRPGNKDEVFADYMQGTDNAKAKLYANGKSVTLKNVAAEAQEHVVDGWSGLDVTYNEQTRYIPHENYDANTWFLAGYYENELSFTVTDGTLTFGISLDESVKDDWVCFDDFCLKYLGSMETDISGLTDAIYANASNGAKGGVATLNISLKNSQTATAYSFDLVLPEGVTLAKDNNNDYINSLSNRHNGQTRVINMVSEQVYKMAVVSFETNEISGNDGVVWTLKLNLDDNLDYGDYAVRIQNATYSVLSGAVSVNMPETIGVLTVANYTKGDVNGDRDVDIADAVCIVNYVVGKPTPAFNAAAADANGDGDVDIADAVRIVNLVVGKISALARQVKWTLPEPE